MSRIYSAFFLILSLAIQSEAKKKAAEYCEPGPRSIHDFSDHDIYGNQLDLRAFRDRVVLVVNVATFCQYTYQYPGLNKLVEKYRGSAEDQRCGLTVFGVPCNQFRHQEPGENAREILNALEYVRPGYGFRPELVMLKKRDVNGANQDGLYAWLKSRCPSPSPYINQIQDIYYSPVQNNDVSWNFEKFLVDHKGHPRKRYTSAVEPEELVRDIEELINDCQQ